MACREEEAADCNPAAPSECPEDLIRAAVVRCEARGEELALARELFEASSEIADAAWELRTRAKVAWWTGLAIGAPNLLLLGPPSSFVGTAVATACFVVCHWYMRRAGKAMGRASALSAAAMPLVFEETIAAAEGAPHDAPSPP